MTDPDSGQLPAVTAGGGVTPHGLRYPGGGDPVYNVPAYLQNLATDIDGKVQHAGNTPDRVFATWVGLLTFGAQYVVVPFPTIRWVRGAIVTRQTWGGGAAQALLPLLSPIWATQESWNQAYWNKLYLLAGDPLKLITSAEGPKYPAKFSGSAGVSILAWGDPVPVGG